MTQLLVILEKQSTTTVYKHSYLSRLETVMYDVRKVISTESNRFMDRFRMLIRSRHYSYQTEKTYCYWVLFYIRFHHYRHPETMSNNEIEGKYGTSKFYNYNLHQKTYAHKHSQLNYQFNHTNRDKNEVSR